MQTREKELPEPFPIWERLKISAEDERIEKENLIFKQKV
jgi:hypothetical protein